MTTMHPVEPVVRWAKPVLRWIDWCVLAEASAELLARPRFPWLRDHARHTYLSPWSRRWWWFAWWLWLAGPAFRLAIRLRIWEVQEGGFYVEGRPRWPWGGR